MQTQSVTMHQQHVTMHQQPVTMAMTHPTGKEYETFQAKSSVSLGALQIIIGILCIVFNVAAIAVDAALSPVSHGIWGGLFFILAGSFGVSAGKYRTSCPIVAFMVLSIIAAVLTIFVLAFSAAGADDDNESYCYWGFCWYEDPNNHSKDARVAMNALLIALAVMETIIAIWSSAICCGAVCCGNKSGIVNSGQRVQYINQTGRQQILIISAGQPGVIAGQPGVTMLPQQYTAYPPQPQAWALPPTQAPGTYYAQAGPVPVTLPQGVSPPAYTTGNPPGYQQATPQAWTPTPGPANAASEAGAPPPPTKEAF